MNWKDAAIEVEEAISQAKRIVDYNFADLSDDALALATVEVAKMIQTEIQNAFDRSSRLEDERWRWRNANAETGPR